MASQISATAAFRLVLKCEITTPILPSGEPLSIVRLVNYILVVFLTQDMQQYLRTTSRRS